MGDVARAEGVAPAGLLRLEDGFAVASRIRNDAVELVAFQRDWIDTWRSHVIGAGRPAAIESVWLVAYEGETGLTWNGYIWGSARPGVSRIEIDLPDATGGTVVGGGWVVAFPSGDIPPHFPWRMLDARGGVIESGRGGWPPVE